jgi:hypothetical protein
VNAIGLYCKRTKKYKDREIKRGEELGGRNRKMEKEIEA